MVALRKMTGHFRNTTWDPLLILSQIVALQCILYIGLGLWIVAGGLLLGSKSSASLDLLFLYQEIHVRDTNGKLVIAAFVLNALVGSVGLWFIVQRTKQCLDFSCTSHLIHLVACWCYNGHFPTAFSWWLLNGACLAIMCVCGEFLCIQTEMLAIPLNLVPKVDL